MTPVPWPATSPAPGDVLSPFRPVPVVVTAPIPSALEFTMVADDATFSLGVVHLPRRSGSPATAATGAARPSEAAIRAPAPPSAAAMTERRERGGVGAAAHTHA